MSGKMGEYVAKRVSDLRIVRQCRVRLKREPFEVWIPVFDGWLGLGHVYRAVVSFETFLGQEVQHEIPLGPFAGGGSGEPLPGKLEPSCVGARTCRRTSG